MLATFTVTTLEDTALDEEEMRFNVEGGLRWAVEQAEETEEADVILFANGLRGNIGLNFGEIAIESNMRILGPGPQLISISADFSSRIFNIADDADDEFAEVEISGLELTGGNIQGGDVDEDKGGAIFNAENLRMTEVILSNNFATQGGGAIYHGLGDLRIWRSLIIDNEAEGIGGGAILIGVFDPEPMDESGGEVEILNSTFSGNVASSEEEEQGYGGAILLARGHLAIEQCTITMNEAVMGGGVAAFGNRPAEEPMNPEDPPPDPPPGPNEATVLSSILWANEGGDLTSVGMTTPDEGEPEPLDSAITSEGYNIIGDTMETAGPEDSTEDPQFFTIETPNGPQVALVNFGGVLPVFYPLPTSPAIDTGNPEAEDEDLGPEQRGRHFRRIVGYFDPDDEIVDRGAVEVQSGIFTVDLFADESDGQFSNVGQGDDPYTAGDFSLREAILFSELNPEVDTVEFISAGTINLTLGVLSVQSSVFIEGPENSIVTVGGSNASRIFEIDNLDNQSESNISIRNLFMQNGRSAGVGGAIFNRENLTLEAVTVRNSVATLRGGGVFSEIGTLNILGSTINNNRASDDGGGVYVNGIGDEVATIVQSTISGNMASDRGAGVTNNNGHVVIKYSTITNNSSASTLASGVNNQGAAARTEIRSTIVSGNANNDFGVTLMATAATFVSLGYNLVGNGVGAANFVMPGDQSGVLNPLLGPLSVSGGRLATHRPQDGSPAIDRGDPDAEAGVDDVPEFDQRGAGFTRVFDGDLDEVDRIDVGSYELQANVIVVDNDGDTIDGNFAVGQVTLREAIQIANLNPVPDVIVFDITSPNLGSSIGVGDALEIVDSVQVMGPGSGVLRLLGSTTNILTIFDGTATLLDVEVSGLELRGGADGAVLSAENLNLDDIVFVGNSSTTGGGALFHQLGHLKINNSLITGNSTSGPNADGGALYILNAIAEITGYTTIVGNSTAGTGSEGGAIAIKNSTVTTFQLTVSGNTTPGGNTKGGGLYIENSTVYFEEGVLSGNTTSGSNSQGGAVAAINSNLTFEKNSLIAQNSTIGSQAPGGGIFMQGGTLVINNSTIVQNTTAGLLSSGGGMALQGGASAVISATTILENSVSGVDSHGGGIYLVGGNLTIRDSLIVGNEALYSQAKGGGVYSDTNVAGTQKTQIVNSTVSGNSAGFRGGGVMNADGRLEIFHSTITNNSTPFMNAGNGVASQGNASTVTVLQSSIIAGNVGTTGARSKSIRSATGRTCRPTP